MESLLERIDALPPELGLAIHNKLHVLRTRDVHTEIDTFVEVQAMWRCMNNVYELCAIDFIEDIVHRIMSSFYGGENETFQRPELHVFQETIQYWMRVMRTFEPFEEYCERQLDLIFTDFAPTTTMGQYLFTNFHALHLTARSKHLYLKYRHTPFATRMRRNRFRTHVLEHEEDTIESIMEMYNDPEFELF
jgi:hypothetical protein